MERREAKTEAAVGKLSLVEASVVHFNGQIVPSTMHQRCKEKGGILRRMEPLS